MYIALQVHSLKNCVAHSIEKNTVCSVIQDAPFYFSDILYLLYKGEAQTTCNISE